MRMMQAAEALAQRLKDEGAYLRVRVLPDGSVIALGDLLFTRAIHMDCTPEGYGRRFCFEPRHLADAQFDALQSDDQEPTGYIAWR